MPSNSFSLDSEQLKTLTDRLDAIIRLLAFNLPKEVTQGDKILILSDLGLQPKDIATMLGTTPNTVRVALSKIRKETITKEDVAVEADTNSESESESPL